MGAGHARRNWRYRDDLRVVAAAPRLSTCGCPKMRPCALTMHDALHPGSLWVVELGRGALNRCDAPDPGVPCVAFCTGCSCRWHAWLCARDTPRTLKSLCSATRASNLPVESPVGVLAATDQPYSVAVLHHRLADVDERPTWRGRTHLWAFGVALPATVVLVAGAHPGRPRLAALIYAISLVAMFGFSAAHHRLGLTHRAGAVLRRLDHSAIYALIAGTYAPVCLVALPPRWGIPLLAIVAGAAGVGMGIKLVAFGRLNVTKLRDVPGSGLGVGGGHAGPGPPPQRRPARPDPGRRARLHGRDGRSCGGGGPIRGLGASATTRSGTYSPSWPQPCTSRPSPQWSAEP